MEKVEKAKVFKRHGRRRSVSFNPSHQFIEESVQDYLEKGGRITRIERVNGNYENFVGMPDSLSSADDFLFDR
ncbi:hypothetical protein KJ966_04550 [bacterium]|nr:hypothetical protein [bacterium]